MDFQDEFRGKTVVLTGAYGIFGTWIAEAFAAYGARLCLSGSSMIRLEALAAKLAPTMVAPPFLSSPILPRKQASRSLPPASWRHGALPTFW